MKAWSQRANTPWEDVEVEWYGGERKPMRLFSRTGLWYSCGYDPVPIRYVRARDPAGALADAGYFSTDEGMLPQEVLRYIVWRWSVEVTFEEVRAHLGMETQRQWSDLAIARTTPALLGLFSLVLLVAVRYHESGLLAAEQAAWYEKEEPTFSDCLRLVRARIWQARISRGSEERTDTIELSRDLVDAVIHGLSSAA